MEIMIDGVLYKPKYEIGKKIYIVDTKSRFSFIMEGCVIGYRIKYVPGPTNKKISFEYDARIGFKGYDFINNKLEDVMTGGYFNDIIEIDSSYIIFENYGDLEKSLVKSVEHTMEKKLTQSYKDKMERSLRKKIEREMKQALQNQREVMEREIRKNVISDITKKLATQIEEITLIPRKTA